MNFYKRHYDVDHSDISVEHWTGSESQQTHAHKYYELLLVDKGSCLHIFKDNEAMLIPGDSFLVHPEQTHSFVVYEHTSIYNCQFFPGAVDEAVLMPLMDAPLAQNTDDPISRKLMDYHANINKQGIVHFIPNETAFLLSLLHAMEHEQENPENLSQLLKKKYLESILILCRKRMDHQYENYESASHGNKARVLQALSYIEENISEEIDFHSIPSSIGWSVSMNHFRKCFKEATGLSPVEYVNRLRITKACAYFQNTDLNIGEVAWHVGINDSNYFSRMFKHYMGFSPHKYTEK
jgi:AraC-like DNA-binding protein